MTGEVRIPGKAADSLGYRPKRFWKTVTVSQGQVLLDGRAVRTPMGAVLTLPTPALTELVAAEWASVGETLDLEAMPLTRYGYAAVDHFAEVTPQALSEARRYASTDLLCYPSDYPSALVTREQAMWRPVLEWAHESLGLDFVVSNSIVPVTQPEVTFERIDAIVTGLSPAHRTGVFVAMPLYGSVVLALAQAHERLTGPEAFAASRVGEAFQRETWGDDAEAARRDEALLAQAQSLDVWFGALGSLAP